MKAMKLNYQKILVKVNKVIFHSYPFWLWNFVQQEWHKKQQQTERRRLILKNKRRSERQHCCNLPKNSIRSDCISGKFVNRQERYETKSDLKCILLSNHLCSFSSLCISPSLLLFFTCKPPLSILSRFSTVCNVYMCMCLPVCLFSLFVLLFNNGFCNTMNGTKWYKTLRIFMQHYEFDVIWF